MEIIVSSFYKYIDLDNPESFQKEHQEFCNRLEIKGKILVAKEGINGTVSGTKEQVEEYEKKINSYRQFSDVKFKRTISEHHPFRKTIVRLRNEIVTSRFNVDAKKVGNHLPPSELKKLYDNNEDFVIVDARNNYESKIGKFKNAITPDIKTFRHFTKVISELKPYKDKKVVLYCTGGVRCEKASALLIKEGFKDVNQVDGGIINYINQFPDTYFEGRCFVFDNRLSVETGQNTKEISICEHCHEPCGNYINCANTYCDKLFISCKECKAQYKNTCSKNCRNVIKQVRIRKAEKFSQN